MNANEGQFGSSDSRPFAFIRGSTVRAWFLAVRPKTLWAAFAPVLIGSAMAWGAGLFHGPAAAAALLGALLIQIGTNFANDYGDFLKGADAQQRTGPLRATQAGLITPRAMRNATVVVFLGAALVTGYLVWRAGWPIVAIGVGAIASGALYTLGPHPLAYRGLGDLFALLFFGPVAVGGTYYVQARVWAPDALLAGLAPGLLAMAILAVNNLRDADGDARVGKRTLAVRFGKNVARAEYVACVLGATVGVPAALGCAAGGARGGVWLACAGALAFVGPLRAVLGGAAGAALNPVLGATARGLLVYAVLFAIGWLL